MKRTPQYSPTLWASPSKHNILCTKSRPSHITAFWFTQSQVISIMKGSTSSFLPSCPPTSWWDRRRIDPDRCTCFHSDRPRLHHYSMLLSLVYFIYLSFFQLYCMCQYIWSIATAQNEHRCRRTVLLRRLIVSFCSARHNRKPLQLFIISV